MLTPSVRVHLEHELAAAGTHRSAHHPQELVEHHLAIPVRVEVRVERLDLGDAQAEPAHLAALGELVDVEGAGAVRIAYHEVARQAADPLRPTLLQRRAHLLEDCLRHTFGVSPASPNSTWRRDVCFIPRGTLGK